MATRVRAGKTKKRGGVSWTSAVSYIGVFLFIATLIAIGQHPVGVQDNSNSTPLANATPSSAKGTVAAATTANTVDPVVATSIASSLADTTSMPVSANVATLSQTLTIETVMSQTSSNTISKPQIVQPTANSRAATTYVTKAGDTVDAVASKYGLKKETVAWANNLSSDALEPNTTLTILPVDGVQHTVKAGDTVDSIVAKYGGNKADMVSYNDLELAGSLTEGKNVIVPGGVLPENERPGYAASRAATNSRRNAASGSYGSNSASGGYGTSYGGIVSAGNKYAWGNCTWYAYERRMQLGRPVGSFWGNASTWAYAAAAAGLAVNGTPAPGAIMQNGGGYGHVAIVESINPGVSITISEMNGYRFGGGFNRVGHGNISWGEATSGYYKYIH